MGRKKNFYNVCNHKLKKKNYLMINLREYPRWFYIQSLALHQPPVPSELEVKVFHSHHEQSGVVKNVMKKNISKIKKISHKYNSKVIWSLLLPRKDLKNKLYGFALNSQAIAVATTCWAFQILSLIIRLSLYVLP